MLKGMSSQGKLIQLPSKLEKMSFQDDHSLSSAESRRLTNSIERVSVLDRSHHLKNLIREPNNRRNILSLKNFEKLDKGNQDAVYIDEKLQFYGSVKKSVKDAPLQNVNVNVDYSHVHLIPEDTTMRAYIADRLRYKQSCPC